MVLNSTSIPQSLFFVTKVESQRTVFFNFVAWYHNFYGINLLVTNHLQTLTRIISSSIHHELNDLTKYQGRCEAQIKEEAKFVA